MPFRAKFMHGINHHRKKEQMIAWMSQRRPPYLQYPGWTGTEETQELLVWGRGKPWGYGWTGVVRVSWCFQPLENRRATHACHFPRLVPTRRPLRAPSFSGQMSLVAPCQMRIFTLARFALTSHGSWWPLPKVLKKSWRLRFSLKKNMSNRRQMFMN